MNYVEGIKIGGATAAQIPCIKGKGVPTTKTAGAVGCLYMDTDNGDMYKCTAVKDEAYIWEMVCGSFYHTTREEVGETHDNINAEYIFGLYDALMTKYQGRVQKKEHTSNDGTFTNYEYVISTGDYPEGSYSKHPLYGNDSEHINKPKYLVMSAIHGTERKTAFSTYRFIRDVLSGHNVPTAFREGVIISVLPVGTPDAFDDFSRYNKAGVNINRNFEWNWDSEADHPGSSNASEKETQAITKWLSANSDAKLFIDFHNNGGLNEKVLIIGLLDDSTADTSKKTALRGVDRVIPFWRDVLKYPLSVEAEGYNPETKKNEVKVRDVIFSYSASSNHGGVAYEHAQKALGIRSIALETASHYGSHTEWVADKKTYSPEAIAMGAEALGNILIEFYQSEVNTVDAEANKKLDDILGIINKGFRVESGIWKVEETIPGGENISDKGAVFTVPCPSGAKVVVFEADSDTVAKTKDYTNHNTKKFYCTLGACVHFLDQDGIAGLREGEDPLSALLTVWVTSATKLSSTVMPAKMLESGCQVTGYTLWEGTYNWTAYYWND